MNKKGLLSLMMLSVFTTYCGWVTLKTLQGDTYTINYDGDINEWKLQDLLNALEKQHGIVSPNIVIDGKTIKNDTTTISSQIGQSLRKINTIYIVPSVDTIMSPRKEQPDIMQAIEERRIKILIAATDGFNQFEVELPRKMLGKDLQIMLGEQYGVDPEEIVFYQKVNNKELLTHPISTMFFDNLVFNLPASYYTAQARALATLERGNFDPESVE